MLNFNVSSSQGSYNIHLQETKDKNDVIVIGKRNYKISGDEKAVKIFKNHIQSISSNSFSSVIDFQASLKTKCHLTVQKKIPESAEKALTAIQQSNGSTQAISKEVKRLQSANTPLSTMMQIASTLAKQGETVKASHFYFHLQLSLDPQSRMDSMSEMGQAFLAYGVEHNDPTALDFALMHILDEKEVASAKQKLSAIASSPESTPLIKAQAELSLKRAAIFDALNPIPDSCNSHEELEHLKKNYDSVKIAFGQAEEIQNSIDAGENPVSIPPGRMIDIEDKEGNTISLHVNLRGSRVHEQDPVVIFEAGLGCFSADWQLVQESLSTQMLTMSYDRAGMGWSGADKAEPTLDRTIDNLKELLDKLELKPPYIFVGHSYGGIVGQLFTVKYPEEVKGLILIDSGLEHVEASLGGSEEPRNKRLTDHLPATIKDFVSNMRVHNTGDSMALKMHYAASKTLHHQTMHTELKHYMPAGAVLLKALKENPEKPIKCPLKIITAAHYLDVTENRPLTEEEKIKSKEWMSGQENLLKRGSNSTQIIAEDSDHFILYHEPELITTQVNAIFNQ